MPNAPYSAFVLAGEEFFGRPVGIAEEMRRSASNNVFPSPKLGGINRNATRYADVMSQSKCRRTFR